ncbi:MAG: hypothetical protein KAS66_00350 [Candidatus Omnitrophica bacterium]|nr:hypothetical protein [Candidatus Omnitrophota bacterium]
MSKWVNGKELAAHLGVTPGRVTQLKNEGVLRVGLNKKFDLSESIKNFRNNKTNAPRIDQAPRLPLDDPGPKATPDHTAPAITVSPESIAHQLSYQKQRARREKNKADREEEEAQLRKGYIINTNLFLPLVRQAIMKVHAEAKSIFLSSPKRAALAMPDPKMRPVAETVVNEVVQESLLALSKIDVEKIYQELMATIVKE